MVRQGGLRQADSRIFRVTNRKRHKVRSGNHIRGSFAEIRLVQVWSLFIFGHFRRLFNRAVAVFESSPYPCTSWRRRWGGLLSFTRSSSGRGYRVSTCAVTSAYIFEPAFPDCHCLIEEAPIVSSFPKQRRRFCVRKEKAAFFKRSGGRS